MQLQDAPANYFFKLWPWFEANKFRLLWGGGIVIVAVAVISFNYYRRTQREIDAGMALTNVMLSNPGNTTIEKQAAELTKIADDYRGTAAGQRAMLQSAALLFEAQKYAEAQARFEQFLGQYSGSTLAAQAALGLAACLDAQSKLEAAITAYQRVINNYSELGAATFAKLRLAQIDEQQGKIAAAVNMYEDIERSNPGSPLGMEARLRAMELKTAPSSAATNPAPAAPFKLSP